MGPREPNEQGSFDQTPAIRIVRADHVQRTTTTNKHLPNAVS